METSLHILAIVCLLWFSALGVRYLVHMFQLNGYCAATQLAWMRANLLRLLPFGALLVLAVACAFSRVYGFGLLAAAALLLSLFYLPKKAKKPLVFTARVIRMLCTLGLLNALCFALGVLLSGTGEFVILGAAVCLEPLLLLLANKINSPVEAAVRARYIKDAKRRLADCPRLRVIGVTGSFGKTSVKYFLTALLREKYNVLMTPESYNTPMGVVKTIRASLRATHDVFVCEMGAKYVGDIRELCELVQPDDGIVTSIGEQHLETFGSIDNIIRTKYELADGISPDGKLFVNLSSPTIAKNPPARGAITYGLSPEADYHAEDISVSEAGTSFTLCHRGERQAFSTRLIGEANVVNIVGALAVACEYGIPPAELRGAVRALKCVPHRMELIDRGPILIIDDAFNSNPAGARAALETVALFGDAMKIIVTPGMIELGEKEAECNAALGREAAAVCDRIVLVGEKQTRPIARGALEAGFKKEKIFVAKTIGEAMDFVYGLNAGGGKKVVLLENDLPDNF